MRHVHDETHHHHGHPGVGLLLLIPVAAFAMHAAKRHQRMHWDEAGGPGFGAGNRGHGRHRFAGWDADPASGEVRLPPRIESMLSAWHTRAHAADQPAEGPTA